MGDYERIGDAFNVMFWTMILLPVATFAFGILLGFFLGWYVWSS